LTCNISSILWYYIQKEEIVKYFIPAFILFALLLSIHCAKEPYNVVISFTNPNDIPVKHGGFYKIESTGDSVGMYGYTPNQYTYTLDHEDVMVGAYQKDTSDVHNTDTLHFELYVDGEILVNNFLVTTDSVGTFRVPEIEE
jgi:hypothetical protein